jgi:hypothetical protein
MFGKATLFLLLIQAALTLTVEINNIHNGYRNIYQGRISLEENSRLAISNYVPKE